MKDHFYNEFFEAEDFHWWFQGRRKLLPSLVRAHIVSPVSILDVGTGGGALASSFLQFGSVSVCDNDPRCQEAVSRWPDLEFHLGQADALPFADNTFDLVTAFDVIEHMADDQKGLREMARVVREGGGIAISVPAYMWLWGRQDIASHHYRRYTKSTLTAAIEGAGLSLERITAFNTLLLPPTAIVRLARRISSSRTTPEDQNLGQSDFAGSKPGVVNNALAAIFSSESRWLKHRNFPIGVSLFAFVRVGNG